MADTITVDDIASAVGAAQCVGVAMAGLPTSYLISTIATMDLVVNSLRAYEAYLEAEIISLDVNLAPLALRKLGARKAAAAVTAGLKIVGDIEATADTVATQVNIIDTAIVALCPALAQVNTIATNAVKTKLDGIRRIIGLTDKLYSVRLEYTETRNQVLFYINYLNIIKGYVQDLLILRNNVILTGNIR